MMPLEENVLSVWEVPESRRLASQPATMWYYHRQYMQTPTEVSSLRQAWAGDLRDLEIHCPLDNGRHDLKTASQDLGNLSIPSELVGLVINHMDIPTLTTFRRVSKYAMKMVDSTFEYQQIMNRAPQM